MCDMNPFSLLPEVKSHMLTSNLKILNDMMVILRKD